MSYDELYIKSAIRSIADWPEAGVIFRDVTTLFKDPKAMRMVCDAFVQRYMNQPITHIASIDARGFILGSVVAYQLNLPLILIRKKGKLPGDTISQDYSLEYGSAAIEIQTDALEPGAKVLVFDDLIATGGTVLAAVSLIRKLGAEVHEVAALIDLPDLMGSQKIQDSNVPVYSLLAYEGL
ncbi:MAG: adenine phosphoribosyltransferase [Nitrincola lacisaponensis]|uniref:adenine phosphoribosyltransferase n=1 Tax=Nitrincola lacisaponensis TaxID=267850 RepID=UPI00391A22CB